MHIFGVRFPGGHKTMPKKSPQPKERRSKREDELLKMFDSVGHFVDGIAFASKNGKFFHIFVDGTPVYEERYDFVDSFSEGRAVVNIGGLWFHILPNGFPAYQERYKSVRPFNSGRASVLLEEEWFYIDHNGNRVD